MIRQKPISARIQYETMWNLEQERMASGSTINKMLNEGARMYLDTVYTRRIFGLNAHEIARRAMVRGYLKKWFPEALEVL